MTFPATPLILTGPTTNVGLCCFDASSTQLPASFTIDLSKGPIGLNYATPPDSWSVGNAHMTIGSINVAHGYQITIHVTGYTAESTGFSSDFSFIPTWNLPL